MTLHRRQVLGSLGFAAVAALGDLRAGADRGRASQDATPGFPRKADFLIDPACTYLNAAYTHPIPRVAMDAARHAIEGRATLPPPSGSHSETPKALFAALINARPSEIAYVSSTSAGENLVVQALDLDRRFDGNVVTDGLHFEGALLHLLELKKLGLDVRIVQPTSECRIDFRDLERAVDKRTRLIEVSSVSMYNGFQHDLKAVSDLAHAHGALVYADIIHSAGAEPFDVKAAGVDFAACSTFKWLMGDFGVGFLYARDSLFDRIRRPVAGYFQAPDLEQFFPPDLPEGAYVPVRYDLQTNATGLFESGTLTGGPAMNVALLAASLNYVSSLGVARIQAHRQPFIAKLQQEVPRLGFTAVTPPESTGPNVTFAKRNLAQTGIPRKLQAAGVNVRLSTHWMRVSPSVYNDMRDIERFLDALS